MKTVCIFGLALAALTACGPLQDDNRLAATAQTLLQRAGGGGEESDSAPVSGTAGLTRAQIEAQPTDLLRLSIISLDATALVFKIGQNGSRTTWVSAEEIGIIFDRGVLVGTRGLGDDLMGSDVSGAIRSLGGGGNHLRTMDFLNGLGQIERVGYQCSTAQVRRESLTLYERSYATVVYEETCSGEDSDFKNTFWRGADGVIWQSRQWISPDVGYLDYQRL